MHTGFKRGRELRRTSYAGETVLYPFNDDDDGDDDDDADADDDHSDDDDGKGDWTGVWEEIEACLRFGAKTLQKANGDCHWMSLIVIAFFEQWRWPSGYAWARPCEGGGLLKPSGRGAWGGDGGGIQVYFLDKKTKKDIKT